MAREPLSKRLRFEIFKRDGFTCQYCGGKPPTVILHVDHVVPVSQGGGSNAENLTTACRDCNLGKAGIPLGQPPQSVAESRELLVEREAQERAYIKFVRSKRKREEAALVEIALALWGEGWGFTAKSTPSVRGFLSKLPYDEILEAAELARAKFAEDGDNRAFKYFCGICWRKIERR